MSQNDTVSRSSIEDTLPLIGMSTLVNMAYAGEDLQPVWNHLIERLAVWPVDVAALHDMSVVLQLTGHREKGLELQANAISQSRGFRRVYGDGLGLRIVAFVMAGDFMANTPVEFLLEGSNAHLFLYYVNAETQSLADVPEHDVAFVAIGESPASTAVLARLQTLLANWNGPVLNADAARIADLTRPGVTSILANEPSILSPVNVSVDRDTLLRLALGRLPMGGLLLGNDYPVVIRPDGTHAGSGFAKVNNEVELLNYLGQRAEGRFNLQPYVDYSSSDGLFRKQRIAFIGGKAYPSHMAVSSNWIVHYLSAEMDRRPERRAEEEAWMSNFDHDFAVRHAQAFAALSRRIGLDYFAIDCAEMPDGRLLVFEVDVAMIVHAMDPADVFPYKKPAMSKLFSAMRGLFVDAAGAAEMAAPAKMQAVG